MIRRMTDVASDGDEARSPARDAGPIGRCLPPPLHRRGQARRLKRCVPPQGGRSLFRLVPLVALASRVDACDFPGHVLIVDDNIDAADTLADLLRLDGYEAQACYGEQQALACARASPPDVVILDIAMPERGGHALARELRALLPDALLIAFTGFSTAGRHRALGPVGHRRTLGQADERRFVRARVGGARARRTGR